jgi:rfaE bifunctional protein kinase chain/domain
MIAEKRLTELLSKMNGKRIAVVGDLMLDRYFWGSVSRISPEAPVPVIDLETEQDRLGGAANVAQNIKSLGGEPLLVGVVGADNSGNQLFNLIKESGFSPDGIVIDGSRPSTVKTRVIAHNQHVVRIDRESRNDVSHIIQDKILSVLRRNIDSLDGIILEDYNKGVIVKTLIKQIITLGNECGKTITVDPKFKNFFDYGNVTLFKPNRKEAEEAMGVKLDSPEDIASTGRALLDRLCAKGVLLTLGAQGMSLFESDGSVSNLPTMARTVADVSGAGDTVISTLTMALAAGATLKEAATLANFAGGIVCGYVGIVPIDKKELTEHVLREILRVQLMRDMKNQPLAGGAA